jgi:predicted ATPase
LTTQDLFITSIHIGKVRHLENIDIALSGSERKHLILTGKNGSGKTSLLEAMCRNIQLAQQQSGGANKSATVSSLQLNRIIYSGGDIEKPDIEINYSSQITDPWDSLFAYIPAVRNEPVIPTAVESVDIQGKNFITRNASKDFLKYVINLYVQYLSAKDSGGSAEDIARYELWFENFKKALRDIYDSPNLKLKPDMKNLAFLIELPGREPFGLHEMADGYKAFIDILMELLMRMESADGIVNYEQSAIVLIDELETHLHVELQKRALPFLTNMFPNTQFIVSTHSPFVITSLPNAVVYDLETHTRLEGDLTEYSYTDIVEGYYDISECSSALGADFNRYVELRGKEIITSSEADERYALFQRLARIPKTSPLATAFDLFEREQKNGKAD